MRDYGGNCGKYVNVKSTKLKVVPLALRTQMMDQRINSAVYVKGLMKYIFVLN